MSFRDAQRANHLAILQLSDPELKMILPVLYDLQEELAKGLHKFFKDKAETYSAAKHAQTLKQVLGAINIAEKELSPSTLAELKSGQAAFGPKSIKNMESMIKKGAAKFGHDIPGLRLPSARILLSTKLAVMHRYSSSAKRYGGEVGRRIQRDLTIGFMRGESIDAIAKRLLGGNYQRLKDKSPAKQADAVAEQNFFRNHSDAVRLVRTELINSYNVTQEKSLLEMEKDDPGWLMMWDATLDKRTCRLCEDLDGKTAKPGKLFMGKYGPPPAHPNDRCGLVPHRKEWT